jgi:hypothetical protein
VDSPMNGRTYGRLFLRRRRICDSEVLVCCATDAKKITFLTVPRGLLSSACLNAVPDSLPSLTAAKIGTRAALSNSNCSARVALRRT